MSFMTFFIQTLAVDGGGGSGFVMAECLLHILFRVVGIVHCTRLLYQILSMLTILVTGLA